MSGVDTRRKAQQIGDIPNGNYTTIDGNGNITQEGTAVTNLKSFNLDPDGPNVDVLQEGDYYWDSQYKVPAYVTGWGNTVQDGMELFGVGVNKTGSDITVEQLRAVYNSDMQGSTMEFAFADARTFSKCSMVGVITAAVEKNAKAPVTTFGIVHDVDTSAYSDGDDLYIAADGTGVLTATSPTYPNHSVWAGRVIYAHANQGMVFINPYHDSHDWIDYVQRGGTTAVTGVGTGPMVFTMDFSTRASLYIMTATENSQIVMSNLPSTEYWSVRARVTNFGAHTITYGTGYTAAGGTMSYTAAGTDLIEISGQGSTGANVIVRLLAADVSAL